MLAPTLSCLVAAALFGASTPVSKPLLDRASPLVLAGLLYLGAALAVAPSALRRPPALRSVHRRAWLQLLGIVASGGVLGPALLLFGLSRAPAGSVALWLTLESVATALLGVIFFKEHLQAQTWIAVTLIVIASALLSPSAGQAGWAVVFVVLACLAWGIDNNLSSIVEGFTPPQVVLAKGVAAGLLNTGAGLLVGATAPSAATVALAIMVGALGYGVSLLLYISAAQQLGAIRSQLIFATGPAFGLALAWLWLGEPMTQRQLFATALMAVAIAIWQRERHDHLHVHPATTHSHRHRHDDGHHQHAHGVGQDAKGWHTHEHTHEMLAHEHSHRPDFHHRHRH